MSFPVTFTDQSTPGPSGPITAWDLDFGDGSTHGTGPGPWSNTYTAAGTYTATLTVTGTGADGTATVVHSVVLSSPGTLSFVGQTQWARPSPGSPAEATSLGWTLVPFTTASGFYSALNSIAPNHYIYYNGSGVLNISSGSNQYGSGACVISFSGKNLASPAVIDLGCSHNIWDNSKITSNYVHIEYTGSAAGWYALNLNNCSNITMFGGDISGRDSGANFMGPTHDFAWWDGYLHNLGGTGGILSSNTIAGAASWLHHINLRLEVARFAMLPSLDGHIDKGAGLHGFLIHGGGVTGGGFHDIQIATYCHDSLQPGETSYGTVWPQGGGGSAIEPGSDSDTQYNYTLYVLAERLNMIPAYSGGPLNPGSSPNFEPSGCGLKCFGSKVITNFVLPWIEGHDLSGAVLHGHQSGWASGSPKPTVLHGRHSNTNQAGVGKGNISQPYDPGFGVVYNDCT